VHVEDFRTTAIAIPYQPLPDLPIAESLSDLFAPIDEPSVVGLLRAYDADEARLRRIAELFGDTGELLPVVQYFFDGNADKNRGVSAIVERLFMLEPELPKGGRHRGESPKGPRGALGALRAKYWAAALQLTDVYDAMPQARRDEWNNSIHEMTTPVFTAESVLPTLHALLNSREQFFAERVDGVFRALSGTHVTNSPTGFRSKMIVNNVHSNRSVNYSTVGTIGDLRHVIARFMGRDEPTYNSNQHSLEYAWRHHCGEWVYMDGGTFRIKDFGPSATAHIEIHPEMAWRLNNVLHSLYPNAIASADRQRPKRKARDFEMIQRPLPFSVLSVIASAERENRRELWYSCWSDLDKNVQDEVRRVLEGLGGVADGASWPKFTFDFDVTDVIGELLASGCLPDAKAHQYYPTPRWLAERVADLAAIEDGMTVLEPSAGQGGLADVLPKSAVCVEISALHCRVLKAKGYKVHEQDFLLWAPRRRFARIVMNPPFDRGRWLLHLEHAASLLDQGGRIVAVLPEGAPERDILPGWSLVWSEPIAYPGTSIRVVILVATRD
jgi:hypothetical protein